MDLALASEQKSPPRAGDDVGEQAYVGRGEAEFFRHLPYCDEVGFAHIGEDQVLFVRDAQFTKGIRVGERGNRVHLVGGGVAGRAAGAIS